MKKLIPVSLLLVLALGGCSVFPPAVSPSPTAALPAQTIEPAETPVSTPAPEIIEKYRNLFHGCTTLIGGTFAQHCQQYELAYTWYGRDSECVTCDDPSTLFYDTAVTGDSVCVAASGAAYTDISPGEILRDLNTEIRQAPNYLYIEKEIDSYRFTFLLNADGTALAEGENLFAQALGTEPSPASIRGIQASRAGEEAAAPLREGPAWELIDHVIDDLKENCYAELKARCGSISQPTADMVEFLYDPENGFLDGETGFQYFRENSYTGEEAAVVAAIPAEAIFSEQEMDREAIKEYWGNAFSWCNSIHTAYSFALGDAEMYLTSDESGVVHASDWLVLRVSRELSPEAAVARILDEYGIEDGLPISNCGDASFAGRILSISRLPSQTVAVVLYSTLADAEAEAFQFRLSEFISDDADLGAYRESIHLVFTVDRRSGRIERAG